MVAQKTVDLFSAANRQWEPKRRLTVSEWADMNRILTTEGSAEPGPWRTDRAPYQREIMDSIEKWEEVAIMASAQVGKTEFRSFSTCALSTRFCKCRVNNQCSS